MTKENLQKAWLEKVNQFKESGKTQAIWCKEQGINVKKFNYWYVKFKDPTATKKNQVNWLPVRVEKVYLACGSTDMRKSIDGLAAIVQVSFSLAPFSACLFVFCNKNRNKLKILHWQQTGFGYISVGWRSVDFNGPKIVIKIL